VFTDGGYGAVMTELATRDTTFRDLLTHMSGLTYRFMQATPIDAIYRAQNLELPGSPEPLGEIMGRLAKVPLIAQPGTTQSRSMCLVIWSPSSPANHSTNFCASA
jgi:hypothetical protein